MKRLTQEEYVSRVKESHGDDIKVLDLYKNRRTKIEVECKRGHRWLANPEPLSKGIGCPECSGNTKRTTDEFKVIVFELVGNEYTVMGDYVNKDVPINMKHNTCGHEFKMRPNSFIRGQRCPKERYERSSESSIYKKEEVIKRLKEVVGNEYIMIGEYKGASKDVTFIHNKCGKEFEQQPTRIYQDGVGCPHCYLSKGEEVVRRYLELKGYDFKEQVRIKECKNKRPLPFDFGVYEGEKLLFLIEYDGIQHFEPKFGKEQFKKTKINDEIKNVYCKENNIPLIRIKYVRSQNPMIFKKKVIEKLEHKINTMVIPSEG